MTCGLIAALTVRVGAQVTTAWQATTSGMWRSDETCVASPTAVRSVASSESVAGSVSLADHRRASIDLSGAVGIGDRACGGDGWSGLAALRGSYGVSRTRFWLAYTAWNTGLPDTAVRHPGISAGIDRRMGRALLSMSVGPRRDRTSTERVVERTPTLYPEVVWSPNGEPVAQETLYVADTVNRPATRRIPDLALAVSWGRRSLGIDAAAHVALASTLQRTDPLARLEVHYNLGPRVSAVAGVVSRAAVPSLDIRAGQVATLGIRIRGGGTIRAVSRDPRSAAATAFHSESDGAGQLSLAVRAVGAQRVEIAGDFTHWVALDLQRSPDGWWRVRSRAEPGVHRLSVRIDGGRWTAPPGTPPVHDEFGATVGLVVVP